MSRSARSRVTSFLSAMISACSARCCPCPGNALDGASANSRIQRRSTFSTTSRSRHACATATPRSVTSLTASSLNSRLNLRLISVLQSQGHDPIVVSTKPAAGQRDLLAWQLAKGCPDVPNVRPLL